MPEQPIDDDNPIGDSITTSPFGQGMTSTDSGYREFSDGMYFIKECIVADPIDEPHSDELLEWYVTGEEEHITQHAYVIDDKATLVFDTLSPGGRQVVLENLAEILDGKGLDYLVISHPEENHAGNTGAILGAYPEATLVIPDRSSHHDLFGVEQHTHRYVEDGDVIDLGNHEVEFHEPIFYDHGMSIWMTENRTDTLFTVDFLGFPHLPEDCLHFADEMEREVTVHQLDRLNGLAFPWFRFADADKVEAVIEHIIETYRPEMLAPAHGQVIRENPEAYLRKMGTVIRQITEDGEDYHIHDHYNERFEGMV